ncbi:MAG: hypothetical protein ACE5JX_18405 [Acidobacteriota bacterium]
MRRQWWFRFPSRLKKRRKRLYKALALYFILIFVTMMWPIYPYFSRVHPLMLGMPFGLFYLVCLLVLSFLVLLGVYLWEEHQDEME